MGAARTAPSSIKSSDGKPTTFAELMEAGSKGQPIQASGRSGGMFGKAGSGLFQAIPNVVGKSVRGKATFSGDAFSRGDQEEKETPKKDEFRTFKESKDPDYEDTKKRLLELAKEEAIKISRSRDIEKEIYDKSLPDSSDNNQKTAEMFLGKDYKKNIQKTIDGLPRPLQTMVGGE